MEDYRSVKCLLEYFCTGKYTCLIEPGLVGLSAAQKARRGIDFHKRVYHLRRRFQSFYLQIFGYSKTKTGPEDRQLTHSEQHLVQKERPHSQPATHQKTRVTELLSAIGHDHPKYISPGGLMD